MLVKEKKKKSPKRELFSILIYSYPVPCNWGFLPDLELGWKVWGEMRQPWKLALPGAWGSWLFFHSLSFLFTSSVQFSSVQSLSHVRLFETPWTAAHQASLCITNSWSLPKLMSIESVMTSSHFILCHLLLLLPSIFPSIRVFSSESAFCIRWPKYWSFSFNISPTSEHPGLISFRMDWLDLLAVQGTFKSLLRHTVQKHQFFSAQLSL